MLRSTKLIAVMLALLVCAFPASASIEGLWWDPSVSGEGWTFVSQNDLAAITWYRYENGAPAFRTVLANTAYAVVVSGGDQVLQFQLTGKVYRTTNFTNTVEVGDFLAVFQPVGGVMTGTVTAEGVTRTLVPFIYNYSSPVEFYRGLWNVSNLANAQLDAGAMLAVFATQTGTLDDGTPARLFETSDGRFGGVYYDLQARRFVAVVLNDDGSFVLAFLGANNKASLGEAALFSPLGVQISDPTLVVAAAIANSDGELAALRAILGLPPGSKGWPMLPSAHTLSLATRQLAPNTR